MTQNDRDGAFAVEPVPIEAIEPGDWVVSSPKAVRFGEPRKWQVHRKRLRIVKSAGQATIYLCSDSRQGVPCAVEAPAGTLILRATYAPPVARLSGENPKEHQATETKGDDAYRHPKCYANTRGGCSTKISGEHFISHGLLKLYSFGDPDAKIKHDNGFGIRQFVPPKDFVTKVLCVAHNNAVSCTDAAALEVAKFLFEISTTYLCGAGEWGEPAEITVSGDDFQNWVLKLILNHVVGKAFTHQKGEFVSPYAAEAVDLLLGRAMWPKTWGMFVGGDPDNDALMINRFSNLDDISTHAVSFQPFIFHSDVPGKANEVGGGVVNLNGVGFGLTFFNPDWEDGAQRDIPNNPFRGSVQRPQSLTWVVGGVEKRINFTWSDVWEHKTLTYTLSDRQQPD